MKALEVVKQAVLTDNFESEYDKNNRPKRYLFYIAFFLVSIHGLK